MLQVSSLNSGSNANCYYIGNDNEAILVDAGLSCRETERRMNERGLDISKLRAIFITHEHADHISGLAGLSKKHKLPVYITDATLRNTPLPLNKDLIVPFAHTKTISIGGLHIIPFQKSHDANDPHSFVVTANGINIGIITDIGYACKQVLHYFSQCHAVFLESNYCPDMLANGNYPYHLQKRISSDEGHLSNQQALELFQHYRSPFLKLLILSHLSKNNNRPELVQNLFSPHAGETEIFVASRYEASPVFKVAGNPQLIRPIVSARLKLKPRSHSSDSQLSLFA